MTTSAPSVQVYLFGGLRIARGGEKITHFRTQKTAALLAYLALVRGRTHPREELVDLFWPEADIESGRTSLRSALSALRRVLEPPGTPPGEILVTEGHHSVHLNAENVTSDVAEFTTALTRAERSPDPAEKMRWLARAVESYTGPLLPGFYEVWALTERDRLAEMYLRALGQLSAYYASGNDFDQALHYARLGISADPLREEAHGEMIRLLRAAGQPAAALRQYQQWEELLREKRDDEPSAAIRALVEPSALAECARGVPVSEPKRVPPPTPALPQPPPLPPTYNRLFGREDEVAALNRLLRDDDTRLVTVTGPGGSGKTRLALEAAGVRADAFPGGVWYAPVADVRDPARLADAVAAALGLPSADSRSPLDRVIAALTADADAPALLVLDNLEHVTDAAADFVAAVLEGAPRVSLLTTSRQRLLLTAEREFPLLPLPTPSLPGTPERLIEFPSVGLFVDCARAARPDFALTTANADAVAALCNRLEGLPLAIELAAAWSQALAPSQLLQRMDRRFDLLVSRRRDVAARHRTLRAAIETSFDLLPPALRRLFAQLSVFRGGWTLEAAEAVCGDPQVLFSLSELRDRSLIVTEDTGGEALRHRMLETLREFAAEQIGGASQRAELARRHVAFFREFAERSAEELNGPGQAEAIVRLDADHDNLRAAMESAAEQGDTESELRLVGALTRFWVVRGHLSEGRRRLAAALGRAGETAPGPLRVAALYGAASLAGIQGDIDAAETQLTASLALFRELGDTVGAANALCSLANVAKIRGDFAQAAVSIDEALPLFHAVNNDRGRSRALQARANLHAEQAEFTPARRCYEESLAISEALGDQRSYALTLHNLGVIVSREDDLAGGLSLLERTLAMRRTLNDIIGQAYTLGEMGTIVWKQGDFAAAERYYEESLTLRRQAQDPAGGVLIHLNRALMALERKETAAAWPHLEQGIAILQQGGNRRHVADALETRARLALQSGDPPLAARLWASAYALRDTIHAPLTPSERETQAVEIDRVRAALGESEFSTAWEAGRLLPDAEALAQSDHPPTSLPSRVALWPHPTIGE